MGLVSKWAWRQNISWWKGIREKANIEILAAASQTDWNWSQHPFVSYLMFNTQSSWDRLLVQDQTRNRKVASSNLTRNGTRIIFSTVNFVCWLYLVSIPSPCYCSSMQKTLVILSKVQVAGYTLTCIHPWLDEVRVGWLCQCAGILWEPIRKWAQCNSSGNTQPQLSQLAEPLWTDLGLKNGNSVCILTSTLKKNKRRQGINCQSPKILACQEKATTINTQSTTNVTSMWNMSLSITSLIHCLWCTSQYVGKLELCEPEMHTLGGQNSLAVCEGYRAIFWSTPA